MNGLSGEIRGLGAGSTRCVWECGKVAGDGLRGDGVKEMSCQRQSLIYKCGQSEWEGTGPETCLLPSYLVARGVETLGVICFA